MFDGTVISCRAMRCKDGALDGTFVRTDFKSFLYWREHGYADGPTRDAFGASLIRSSDGYVLLGRAERRQSQLRARLSAERHSSMRPTTYAPAAVDIDASIARELEEETGLTPADLERRPGYVADVRRAARLDRDRMAQPAAARTRCAAHPRPRRAPAEPELADVVIVRCGRRYR